MVEYSLTCWGLQLDVPQWQQGKSLGGGKIAVIYMKETDTYYLCRTLAEVVGTYAGLCK